MKKLISLLISVCMIITLIPTIAFAADQSEEPMGSEAVMELDQPEDVDVVSEETVVEEELPAAEDMKAEGWTQDPDGHWMYYVDGAPVTGFYPTDPTTAKYYFDENGFMLTDWQTIDGHKYYFDPNGTDPTDPATNLGLMQRRWLELNGAKYYFNPKNGIMQTGWIKVSDKRYYLDKKTGAAKKGWQTISKKKYYFDKTTCAAYTGLKTISKTKYYFDSNGVMKTGVIKISGDLYFFKSNGKAQMKKGWFTVKKKKRYCYGNGKIASGTAKVGSTWYVFSTSTGVLIRKIGDAVDKEVQSMSSSTNYLVAVVRSSHQTRVYKGKKGNWSRVKTWSCMTGKSSTPTPAGSFKIYKKVTYNQNTKTNCRWWYCTYFTTYKGTVIYFQSILYDTNPTPGKGKVLDGRLGISASDGCVRLSLTNSQWIFNNVPIGTKVYVK